LRKISFYSLIQQNPQWGSFLDPREGFFCLQKEWLRTKGLEASIEGSDFENIRIIKDINQIRIGS